MRYSHGISYGRMQQMLGEVFGLEMSQGAIANLLSRVKSQLQSEVDGILVVLRYKVGLQGNTDYTRGIYHA